MYHESASKAVHQYPKGIERAHREIKDGLVTTISSKNPIVVYATTTVKQACGVMVDNGIRRAPVVDAGTKKLVGILSARDLVDFFGGGEKYNIIRNEFKGNIFAAINLPISKIMKEQVISVKETDSVEAAAEKLLEGCVGGCPVVDHENHVVGMVSERDFIKKMAQGSHDIRVSDLMSRNVLSIDPEASLISAAKMMISKGFRRLPVVENGELVAILRTTSILRFISAGEFARFGTADAEEILGKEKVRDAMRSYFVTVRPNDEIEEVIGIILAKRIGGLPVEENGKLVGVITEHDIFRAAYSK
jgi:CBS domain-containing protein